MAIRVTCPHCGLETDASDEFAGQTGPCAGCGKPVTVPAANFKAAASGVGYASAVPSRPSRVPAIVIVLAVGFVVLLFLGGVLAALLLPAMQSARGSARRSACTNNLRQIAVALHGYHQQYGCLPPAYIADDRGRPQHSWRVLLLPFVGRKDLYARYDFNQPWNGPNNRALAAAIPDIYRCPEDSAADPATTSYLMVTGPGTIGDGPLPCRFSDIFDGLSHTIAVVEVSRSGVNWLEPEDLDTTMAITYAVNDGSPQGIRSDHPNGANVLMADGVVRKLEDHSEPDVVAAMTTIAGGEVVD